MNKYGRAGHSVSRKWAFSTILCAIVISAGAALCADGTSNYLPLSTGRKWVLRSGGQSRPVEIEVVRQDGDSYLLRFSTPWNQADWKLTPNGGAVALTGYGTGGELMPLPASNIFFDFASGNGKSWKSAAGNMSAAKGVSVSGKRRSYTNCVTIRQDAGGSNFAYTFAPNVGFVQFGEGNNAFVLDEDASRLDGSRAPTPLESRSTNTRRTRAMEQQPSSKPLIGTTVTTFANESDSPDNLMKRFDQSMGVGTSYVSGAGKWTELEPSKGKLELGSLDFQAHLAQTHGAKMSYTLRMIDTIHKAVPPDLMKKGWMDGEMQSRVIRLIEAIAPLMKDRVQWFCFGNEIDGYFDKHPDEVASFVQLYDLATKRLREIAPNVQTAATVQFHGLDRLNGLLRPLNDRFQFLSITYYPMNGDFTVKDPKVPQQDMPRMKTAANGRQVILQEIGYPTGSPNKSSEDMQAAFFTAVFDQMSRDPRTFAAGSVFLMADLRDKLSRDLAAYYGITGHEPFRTFLQTLGMFDTNGRPKKSWSVFQNQLKR